MSKGAENPLLLSFLGYPGSGKTHFSKQLADILPAVVLNGDAIKLEIYGSREEILRAREVDREQFHRQVFDRMDHEATRMLAEGHSVIYDAQQSTRQSREHLRGLAKQVGAVAVIAWVQTSRETALRRGLEREPGDDSIRHDAEKMIELFDRFDRVTELPRPDENVIEISGEVPFEEQYKAFLEGLDKLRQ